MNAFIRLSRLPLLLLLSHLLHNLGQAQVIATFTLPSSTGQTESLATYANRKAVVVLFTSTHCSYAEKYVDRVRALYQTFASQGVAFLAINSNDPALNQNDALPVMRLSQPYPFPYLKDETQQIARLFNASKNPEVFILQPISGSFNVVYHGKIDDNPLDASMVRENYLRDALQQIIAGNKPAAAETPAAGCNIRWQ
jgi:peroxiredoxin